MFVIGAKRAYKRKQRDQHADDDTERANGVIRVVAEGDDVAQGGSCLASMNDQ